MSADVGSILRQIHDLLHEALSNVEIPIHEGRELIDRVASAESEFGDGSLSINDLEDFIEELHEGIAESIKKEEENNNPFAAVMQVRDLLNHLSEETEQTN